MERIFWTLCKEWSKSGHEVTIFARRHPGQANDDVLDGVRFIRVASHETPKAQLLYRLLDILYAARVALALRSSDITITHSVSMPLLLPRGKAGRIYVSVGRFPKGQMWLYRKADRLQAVSGAVADAIRAQSPDVSPLVRVIPNCLSQAFAAAIAGERGARQKEILFVGRIAREKGIHLLISAFKRIAADFPDWRVSIVGPHEASEGGDGQAYLDELKSLALSLEDRVSFGGAVFKEEDLIARYRRADVFVYPSLAETGESFGMSPLEAMACGCATIVSKLDCFRDFVSNGVNAHMFDHRETGERALADVLSHLLLSDERRSDLGEAGKATARRFTPSVVSRLFLADFTELCPEGAETR